MYVEVQGNFNWIFARALGMTNAKVGAQAAARVGSYSGGHDIMPWSILQGDSDCLDAAGKPLFAASCSVKVGAQSKYGGGWRGALDLDGNGGGANEYRDNIIDGRADTYYCIDGQVVPPCETSVVDIKNGKAISPRARNATPTATAKMTSKRSSSPPARSAPRTASPVRTAPGS
jgi:hypothetical protein